MARLLGSLLLLLFSSAACAQTGPLPLESIKLPPGFAIELVARVENAREMTLGPKGTLFVGSMQAGKVYAVRWKPGASAEVCGVLVPDPMCMARTVPVSSQAAKNGSQYRECRLGRSR